ncbi:nuclear transport factor 2 family protein [Sphingomonas sp. BIUV-7]|uniref:Nuclear transport factor 2 family protein n=1 Tax=Sphingomonas natans TaxID=3063330 RepID=A0ABT8Y896_9SPHN|nr:nuclear transport factor 2 family protein [Sphingomonas sp. BIUV-7]MDO6414551.1 nuclear transport factor 2 family protein [Sphingomonas sp. BIUV-7]
MGGRLHRKTQFEDKVGVNATSSLDTLLALEDIKLLKARRDRAVDTKDWDLYRSLHAPDHESHHEGLEPWIGADEMMRNVRERLGPQVVSVHHSHTPEITFTAPDKATGIWAMEDNIFWEEDGANCWMQGFGFYHEDYERRDGAWLFVKRELKRTHVKTSKQAIESAASAET